MDDAKGGSSKGDAGVKDGSPKEGGEFDVWLEHRLHDMYDSVVNEPVPSELMELVKKHSKP